MTAATVQAVGDEHANHAGAVLNTNRQLGILVGVATIGLILGSTSSWYDGLHIALGLVAGGYLVASAAALILARATRRAGGRAGSWDACELHPSPGAAHTLSGDVPSRPRR